MKPLRRLRGWMTVNRRREMFLALPPGARVLDVGCGNDAAYHAKNINPRVVYEGIDVGDYNLAHPEAFDRYTLTGSAEFADTVARAEGPFDLVISNHNLEHCEDPARVVAALCGQVKPGGTLYLAFPSARSDRLPSRGGSLNFHDDATHLRIPDAAEVFRTLERSGLTVTEIGNPRQPFKEWLLGLVSEPASRWCNQVLPGTWAFWGFETMIVARRGRTAHETRFEFFAQGRARAGWQRLEGESVFQSGPTGARVEFFGTAPDERLVIELPYGINGWLDHVFHLPFAPERMEFQADVPVTVGSERLRLRSIPAAMAWALMGWRLRHYLTREGTLARLGEVERLLHLTGRPPVPGGWLTRRYGLIKEGMRLRSLPLADYPSWLRLQRERTGAVPIPDAAVSVVVDSGCGQDALHATLDALSAQTLRPARVVEIDDGDGHGLRRALDAVRTDLVMVLRGGDVPDPTALACLAGLFAARSETVCVYGDEDYSDGETVRPVFKPDFDPVLQATAHYIGRCALFATEYARSLAQGDFQAGLARAEADRVAHVPRVLLHLSEPPVPPAPVRKPPASTPLVSVVIPTRDRLSLLAPCVESLRRVTDYPAWEIVIVDNGSREQDTLDYLRGFEERGEGRVVRANMEFNYSRLNNLGVQAAQGEILVFLNNDVETLHPEWLGELVAWAQEPGVGSVGAKLLYPGGGLQHAGVAVGLVGIAGHPWKRSRPEAPIDFRLSHPRTVSANTGACLAVRRTHFLEAGGFDETLAVAFNDVDLCLKLQRAGLRNVWTPLAALVHHESVSRGRNDTPEKQARFEAERRVMLARWGEALCRDPYYSPNLTSGAEDGGLNPFPPPACAGER
jgi:GT2 family glycosyltransferase/SAM-dependent methyltransferase